jgi:hypothetical protein
VILSGLDGADDALALVTVRGGWGLAVSDEHWATIESDARPVVVNIFLAPGSFSDAVIRGGIACLGTAFGLLLGTGTGEEG